MSLRVLLAMHHRMMPGGGAPGATLEMGSALADLGCKVDFFGYEHAFGHDAYESVGSSLTYPWRLASHLHRRAADFDLIDVSAGDAWVFASRRQRVRNRSLSEKSPALISRSYELEHTLDQSLRADAKAGKLKLSIKYPFYHGGYRLWEVRKSLQLSDHTILRRDSDRDYAVDFLDLSPLQTTVISNGINRQFLGLWEPEESMPSVPIKLVSAGNWNWLEPHARRLLIDTASQLCADRLPFVLTLVGTTADEVEVRGDFSPAVRPHIRVIPNCRPHHLPGILQQHQVALQFNTADVCPPYLPEMMACGLAPIAVRTPEAARILHHQTSGQLINPGDFQTIARIIRQWSADRAALHACRLRAQQTAQRFDWSDIAAQTLAVYDRVLRRIAGTTSSPTMAPTRVPAIVPAMLASAPLLPPAKAIWQRSGKPTLSLCICTANRPTVLRRCLTSIEQGQSLPVEVVVGDDTLDGSETAAVCGEFPFVRYVRGPRRGLCSNRNVVIAAALGDYVALLDDDSEVTPEFVRLAHELIASADGRTIFTGDVMEHGVDRVPPSNPTFWGHLGKPLAAMGQCETIHLNCNIFPRSAFEIARFDERIVYGYEDMDLCQQMLASGYRIEYRRQLVNLHLPPPKTRELRRSQDEQAERARYYTSLKRYMLWQSRPIRALLYAALAPLHQAAHHLLHRQLSQALVGFSDMSWAVHQALEFRKTARESSASPIITPAALGRRVPRN
jgi:GT2 family glycosyltransferase/glycosyltransferase involved in cell wall biosynthesis